MSEINFFDMSFDNLPEVEEPKVLTGKSTMQIISETNAESNIPYRFSTARFNDHPDVMHGDVNVTQQFKSFCLEKQSDKIFALVGDIGVGKTTLGCAAIHERSLNGLAGGMYLSCRTLKPMIMTSRSFKASESEMDLYTKYSTTPFLFLDELGKCTDSDIEWDFFTTIISLRFDNYLPTAFTSNMDLSQIRTFICRDGKGNDIYDRMKSVFKYGVITGNSHRGEKNA